MAYTRYIIQSNSASPSAARAKCHVHVALARLLQALSSTMTRTTAAGGFTIPQYDWEDLKEPHPIAHGTTTTIFKGTLHSTPVAAKLLCGSMSPEAYPLAAKDIQNEAFLNTRLRHPHIVLFLGVVEAPRSADPHGLLFEYAERKLKCARYGPGKVKQGVAVALAISRALAHAHALGIIHRDVKPSQVLFCNSVPKLGDWGLARYMAKSMTGETGTWEFMAPEIVRNERYDESADVYSLGMLLFAIVNGLDYPFEKEFLTPIQAAMGVANNELRPKWSSRIGENVRSIVEDCWAEKGRPLIPDVIDRLIELEKEDTEEKGWSAWLWG